MGVWASIGVPVTTLLVLCFSLTLSLPWIMPSIAGLFGWKVSFSWTWLGVADLWVEDKKGTKKVGISHICIYFRRNDGRVPILLVLDIGHVTLFLDRPHSHGDGEAAPKIKPKKAKKSIRPDKVRGIVARAHKAVEVFVAKFRLMIKSITATVKLSEAEVQFSLPFGVEWRRFESDRDDRLGNYPAAGLFCNHAAIDVLRGGKSVANASTGFSFQLQHIAPIPSVNGERSWITRAHVDVEKTQVRLELPNVLPLLLKPKVSKPKPAGDQASNKAQPSVDKGELVAAILGTQAGATWANLCMEIETSISLAPCSVELCDSTGTPLVKTLLQDLSCSAKFSSAAPTADGQSAGRGSLTLHLRSSDFYVYAKHGDQWTDDELCLPAQRQHIWGRALTITRLDLVDAILPVDLSTTLPQPLPGQATIPVQGGIIALELSESLVAAVPKLLAVPSETTENNTHTPPSAENQPNTPFAQEDTQPSTSSAPEHPPTTTTTTEQQPTTTATATNTTTFPSFRVQFQALRVVGTVDTDKPRAMVFSVEAPEVNSGDESSIKVSSAGVVITHWLPLTEIGPAVLGPLPHPKTFCLHIPNIAVGISYREDKALVCEPQVGDIAVAWSVPFQYRLSELAERMIVQGLLAKKSLNALKRKRAPGPPKPKAAKVPRPKKSATVAGKISSVNIKAAVTEQRELSLVFPAFEFRFDNTMKGCNIENVRVSVNGINIGTITSFTARYTQEDKGIPFAKAQFENDERKSFTPVDSPNETVQLEAETLVVSLPFDFHLGQAIADIQSAIKITKTRIKMIGEILKKERPESTKPSAKKVKFIPNIVVRVDDARLDLMDDEFEAKMALFWELAADEQVERMKRHKLLLEQMEKIAQMQGLAQHPKISEIDKLLEPRDSAIYIQRWKEHAGYNQPVSRPMSQIILRQLELFIMPDYGLRTQEDLEQRLQEIDKGSDQDENGLTKLPPSITTWDTLVGAKVCLQTQRFAINFYDYERPFIALDDAILHGTMIVAEANPPATGYMPQEKTLGDGLGVMKMRKKLALLKFYQELQLHCGKMEVTWGPPYDAALSSFSMGTDRLATPSSNTGSKAPKLASWDKFRLLFHGRLFVQKARVLEVFLNSGYNPLLATDGLVVSGTDMVGTFGDSELALDGAVSFCIRTISKYDECTVLVLPDAEIRIKFGWITDRPPISHQLVQAIAPPFLTDVENYDMYADYRTKAIELDIVILGGSKGTANPRAPNGVDGQTKVEGVFYANNIQWLSKFFRRLASRPLPIRNGRLYKGVRPKKEGFGSTMTKMGLTVGFRGGLLLDYWTDSEETTGLALNSGPVILDMIFNIRRVHGDFGKSPGELGKARHRSSNQWSVRQMVTTVDDLHLRAKHSAARMGMYAGLDEDDYGFEHLISCKKVQYKRADTSVTDGIGGDFTHLVVMEDSKASWTKGNWLFVWALIKSYQQYQQLRRDMQTSLWKAPPPSKKVTDKKDIAPSMSVDLSATSANVSAGDSVHKLINQLLQASSKVVGTETEDHSARADEGGPKDIVSDAGARKYKLQFTDIQINFTGEETYELGSLIATMREFSLVSVLGKPCQSSKNNIVVPSYMQGNFKGLKIFAAPVATDPVLRIHTKWVPESFIHPFDGDPEYFERSVYPYFLIAKECSAWFLRSSAVDIHEDELAAKLVVRTDELQPLEEDTLLPSSGLSMCQSKFRFNFPQVAIRTTSTQYQILVDVISHSLDRGHTDSELHQSLKYVAQLSTDTNYAPSIQQRQEGVRKVYSLIRQAEYQLYLVLKQARDGLPDADEYAEAQLVQQTRELKEQLSSLKSKLNSLRTELRGLVSFYKNQQESGKAMLEGKEKKHLLSNTSICVGVVDWQLYDDLFLNFMQAEIRGFEFEKTTFGEESKTDETREMRFQAEKLEVINKIPNDPFPNMISPVDSAGGIDKSIGWVRVFIRERPPVGGISCKEHFEINVNPMRVCLTYDTVVVMQTFFFGRADDQKGTGVLSCRPPAMLDEGCVDLHCLDYLEELQEKHMVVVEEVDRRLCEMSPDDPAYAEVVQQLHVAKQIFDDLHVRYMVARAHTDNLHWLEAQARRDLVAVAQTPSPMIPRTTSLKTSRPKSIGSQSMVIEHETPSALANTPSIVQRPSGRHKRSTSWGDSRRALMNNVPSLLSVGLPLLSIAASNDGLDNPTTNSTANTNTANKNSLLDTKSMAGDNSDTKSLFSDTKSFGSFKNSIKSRFGRRRKTSQGDAETRSVMSLTTDMDYTRTLSTSSSVSKEFRPLSTGSSGISGRELTLPRSTPPARPPLPSSLLTDRNTPPPRPPPPTTHSNLSPHLSRQAPARPPPYRGFATHPPTTNTPTYPSPPVAPPHVPPPFSPAPASNGPAAATIAQTTTEKQKTNEASGSKDISKGEKERDVVVDLPHLVDFETASTPFSPTSSLNQPRRRHSYSSASLVVGDGGETTPSLRTSNIRRQASAGTISHHLTHTDSQSSASATLLQPSDSLADEAQDTFGASAPTPMMPVQVIPSMLIDPGSAIVDADDPRAAEATRIDKGKEGRSSLFRNRSKEKAKPAKTFGKRHSLTDDVVVMRQRARTTNHFTYVKVTRLTISVTWRGYGWVTDLVVSIESKELRDLRCTWKDLAETLAKACLQQVSNQSFKHFFGQGQTIQGPLGKLKNETINDIQKVVMIMGSVGGAVGNIGNAAASTVSKPLAKVGNFVKDQIQDALDDKEESVEGLEVRTTVELAPSPKLGSGGKSLSSSTKKAFKKLVGSDKDKDKDKMSLQ